MRLDPEEREWFKKDGLDPSRAMGFLAAEKFETPLDDADGYLSFLQGIQALCGPMSVFQEPAETRFNKL